MHVEQLISRYPNLWHMADLRNLRGIIDHGLLSTSTLLDLYDVSPRERLAIERAHRPETFEIRHARYGSAFIRDQKPMSIARVKSSLSDSSVEDFLQFLNMRVFFWLMPSKLAIMNTARAYRDDEQLVFVLSTARLLKAHTPDVRLSPMNSGATSPFAHPRSIRMFRTVSDFDFDSRAKAAHPIVELTVQGGVPDVFSYVERTEIWKGGKLLRTMQAPYDD